MAKPTKASTSTFNIMERIDGRGVRKLVFAFSPTVYGDNSAIPKVESMLAERIIRAAGSSSKSVMALWGQAMSGAPEPALISSWPRGGGRAIS